VMPVPLTGPGPCRERRLARSPACGHRPGHRVHRRVGEEGAPDAQGHSPWGPNRGVRGGLAQFACRSVLVCRAVRRQA
jgi:hypothetical protein